jgi:4-amino-4-deoxy-L-arabinose transferase-like glycosyltransferase
MRDRRPPALRDLTQPQAVLKRVGPIWPLLAILVLQAALSLRLIWTNSAFQDEALYLWSGHLEWLHWLNGTSIPNFSTYFSGAPVLYPPLGALADGMGGLAAARLLSLAFMLTATLLLWSTTGRLFGRRAALGAAATFSVLGVTQFLGAFATYDAMALCLLALAAWLTVRARGWGSELLIISAALAISAANATKYATALWDPIIIAMAILSAHNLSWMRAILRGARLIIYTAIAIGIALHFAGHDYVRGIFFTTINRQVAEATVSASTVLHDSFDWVGIIFILALLGLIASWRASVRERTLVAVLILAVLLAPMEQARIHTTISLHKHVAFGAWFAAIAVGYGLARASEVHRWKGWRISFAVTILAAVIGINQADSMYDQGWPNTKQTAAQLAMAMPKMGCPCMLADYTVAEYYLNVQNPAWQITGPYAFDYYSNTQHHEYQGLSAYNYAIKEHYFTIVQLDPEASPSLYSTLSATLAHTPGYRKLASLPNSLTPRLPIQIWWYEP